MYRALYRKWRPQRFEDVVGQRAIVTALKNQIAAGRVGHAYLFTGVRGTGKTTCAKIFAKAVNCLAPKNGDPCGVCDACRGIDNGSILDVVEMDAASNNRVEDIRDLRDETAYTPSVCRYKVYIIDEVHMLSTAAFNALLKTLEEPPAHVIFVLATTEIQKVPATILSRCQRYDFTRILPEDIAGRVAQIAAAEKLSLTPGGADLIARLADGALRDALSILDTCAGVTAQIDEDVVRRMAGVTDRSYLFRISDAVAARDGVTALAELAALRQQSVDVKRLSEELVAHYRSLMLAALPGGRALLSGVSPEEEQRYLDKAQQIGQGEAIRAIRALGAALEKMTRGNDQRIELELAVFSLTEPVQAAMPAQAQPMPAGYAGAAPARPAVQPFASAPAVKPFAAAPVASVAEGVPFAGATMPNVPLQSTPAQAASTVTQERPTDRAPDSVAASVAQARGTTVSETAQPPRSVSPPSFEQAESQGAIPLALSAPPAVPVESSGVTSADVGSALREEFPLSSASEDRPSAPSPAPKAETSAHGADIPAGQPLDDEAPLPEPPPPPEEAPPISASEALPWDAAPTSAREVPPARPRAEAPRPKASSAAAPAPQYAADPNVSKERVVAAEGINPFPAWGDVVKRLQDVDPMLYPYLKRSKAYFDGKRILIDGGNMFREFIRQNKDSQKRIKQIIKEVSGVSVSIGPYVPMAQQTAKRGNAEDALHSLAQMGLDVEIRDTARPKRKG